MSLGKLFPHPKTIIGMIHLPALPGYTAFPGMNELIEFALDELDTLQTNGIHGVLIENENDKPHAVTASPEVIGALSVITKKVVEAATIPVGIEVLLNDPKASLAIAKAAGAQFIRTDYFVDKMARDEHGGEMYINPEELMTYRKKIAAEDIEVIADIQVKYATLLEENKPIELSVKQAIDAGASAVLVSGTITGESPNLPELKDAKKAAGKFPVMLGSGFSVENAKTFLKYSDGAIVGTSLKSKGRVDGEKVKSLMNLIK